MSLTEKDEKAYQDTIDVENILADFFLKEFEMKNSKSDYDEEHQRKSKHKKHKKSKHKLKTRSRSSSPVGALIARKVDERVFSSEEKDIKRLKKIKNIEARDNKVGPYLPALHSTLIEQYSSENHSSLVINTSGDIDVPYGPSLELLLSGAEVNRIENESGIVVSPSPEVGEACSSKEKSSSDEKDNISNVASVGNLNIDSEVQNNLSQNRENLVNEKTEPTTVNENICTASKDSVKAFETNTKSESQRIEKAPKKDGNKNVEKHSHKYSKSRSRSRSKTSKRDRSPKSKSMHHSRSRSRSRYKPYRKRRSHSRDRSNSKERRSRSRHIRRSRSRHIRSRSRLTRSRSKESWKRNKSLSRSRPAKKSRSKSKESSKKSTKHSSRSGSRSAKRSRSKESIERSKKHSSRSRSRSAKKPRSRSKESSKRSMKHASRSRSRSTKRSRSKESSKRSKKHVSRSRSRSVKNSRSRSKESSKKHLSRSQSRSTRKSRSRSKESSKRSTKRSSRSRSRSVKRSRSKEESSKRSKKHSSRSQSRSAKTSRSKSKESKNRVKRYSSRSRSKSVKRSRSKSKESRNRGKRRSSRSQSRSTKRSRSKESSKRSKKHSSRSRSRSPKKSRSRSKESSKRSTKHSSRSPSKSVKRSRSKSKESSKRNRRHSSRSRSRSTPRHRKRTYSRSYSRDRYRSKHTSRGRNRSYRSRSYSRGRSNSRSRRESSPTSRSRSKRSHSKSREKNSDSIKSNKIDQAKILQIAQKNVLTMIEKGTLPEGLSLDLFKKEQLVSLKSGGKSVQELTDFCVKLSEKENESNEETKPGSANDANNNDGDSDFIHHPFKLKEQPMIKLNIKNAVQIPIKTHAEKFAETAKLSSQFPVSSGNQHKQKELEWIPVVPEKSKSVQSVAEPKTAVSSAPKPEVTQEIAKPVTAPPTPVSSTNTISHIPLPAKTVPALPPPPLPPLLPPPPPSPLLLATSTPVPCQPDLSSSIYTMPTPTVSYPTPPCNNPFSIVPNDPVLLAETGLAASSSSAVSSTTFKPTKHIDISSIVTRRFKALTKLQADATDALALQTLHEAQSSIQEWVESQQVPGLFTGSTDAKLLTVEELCGPKNWNYRVKRVIICYL